MTLEYLTVSHLSLKDLERLFSKITVHPDAQYNGTSCWLWCSTRDKYGYGRIRWWYPKRELVHRLVFAWLVEPLPRNSHKHEIDHLCRRPSCVNPIHLEVVPSRVNHQRGFSPDALNSRKTHCKRGHLLDGDNLSISPKGSRICRVCTNARIKAHLQTPKGRATQRRLERNRYTDPVKREAMNARRRRRYAQRKQNAPTTTRTRSLPPR